VRNRANGGRQALAFIARWQQHADLRPYTHHLPFPQQLIPAIAVMDVIAVVAVVATTETMPMIATQQQQPHPV
jgi:hypothetical protein